MERLSVQEEEAMQKIWQLERCICREILALYKEKIPYTTLASIVKNLERKGYVKGIHQGNTYVYAPLVSQETYKSEFTKGFIQNYFANSYKEMVSFFAKEQKISPDDLKEIIDMIESKSE